MRDINVPVSRIQEILANRRKLSMDSALRLAHYFGTSEQYFIDLQTKVTLQAERKLSISHRNCCLRIKRVCKISINQSLCTSSFWLLLLIE